MVPIISIGYKTTYLFLFLKTKSSLDPKGFVIGRYTPWYVPTFQTIAPLRTLKSRNLKIFMTCLHIIPCCHEDIHIAAILNLEHVWSTLWVYGSWMQ
jgi:hypothetical protein